MNDADREAWERWARGRAAGTWQREVRVTVTPLNKFHAQPVVIEGVRFASTREGDHYRDLRLREQAGEIEGIDVHPVYPIQVVPLYKPAGPPWEILHAGIYTADFRYLDRRTGEIVIEDVKSPPTRTTDYKLRKHLVELIHGVTITEVA